ncbi:polysaccharide deacetylase family protein [Natronococcus occultus]|uniref:Putative xylanase/chitin deacetylase n=1 Tax=Natronococcus occultus SP4 TaxID=694430 RepID=L0K0Y5_9EURY|nr:polysaccharide deacetylase family protein [Natronococcus occultus]AGB38215.1 putative xylanase/chitin deacetylase [Natronococcus occultus SP4]
MDDDRGAGAAALETQTTRRGLFGLAAGGLLALTGTGAGAASTADEETSGKVVFIYDDSWREDWDQTFPVHQEKDAPACCAAVTEYVDTSWGLLPEHLREMEESGWEIMSHTSAHDVVGNLYLTEPAEPEDDRLAVDGSFLTDHDGEPIVIGTDGGTVENVIAGGGEDDDGFFLDLEEPVGEAFAAEETFVRFTDERIRKEVVGSKEELEEMGVDVDYFVSPFGRSEGLVEELVGEHYAGFANREGDGLNGLANLDPYDLGRTSIDGRSSSRADIETFYDQVAAGDYLGIVVGHSQFEETTEERVRFAIQEARERDLEIVTLREALSAHGVGPDEVLGADDEESTEDANGDDGAESNGDNGDDEGEARTEEETVGSAIRENGPSIAAGTGLLATIGLVGRAAYRRLNGSDGPN